MELPECRDPKDLKVRQAGLVLPVEQVLRVLLETQALLELRDLQETLERPVALVLSADRERLEQSA